jgi:hypothetical protein
MTIGEFRAFMDGFLAGKGGLSGDEVKIVMEKLAQVMEPSPLMPNPPLPQGPMGGLPPSLLWPTVWASSDTHWQLMN